MVLFCSPCANVRKLVPISCLKMNTFDPILYVSLLFLAGLKIKLSTLKLIKDETLRKLFPNEEDEGPRLEFEAKLVAFKEQQEAQVNSPIFIDSLRVSLTFPILITSIVNIIHK